MPDLNFDDFAGLNWFVDSGLIYTGPPVSGTDGLDHLEGEEVTIFGFAELSAGGALNPYVCEPITYTGDNPNNDPLYRSGFQPTTWVADHVKQETYGIYSLDTFASELIVKSMTTKTEVRRVTLPDLLSDFLMYGARAVEIEGVDWIMVRSTDFTGPSDVNYNTILNTVTGAYVSLPNLPVGAQAVGGVNDCEPLFAMEWAGNPDYFLSIWRVEQDFTGATPEMEKTAVAIGSHHRVTGVSQWLAYADEGPAKSFIGSFGETIPYFTQPYQVTATHTSFFIAIERRALVWPAVEPTAFEIWQLNVDAAGAVTFSLVSSFLGDLTDELIPPDTLTAPRLTGGFYDAGTDKFVASWHTQVSTLNRYHYFTSIERSTGAVVPGSVGDAPGGTLETYYIGWTNVAPLEWTSRNDLLPGLVMLNSFDGTGGNDDTWYILDIATMTYTVFADSGDASIDFRVGNDPAGVLTATECAIHTFGLNCAFPDDAKILLCATPEQPPIQICTDIVVNGEVQFCGLLAFAIVGLPTEACIRLLSFAVPTTDGSIFSRDVRVDGLLVSVMNTRYITAQSGHADLIPEPLLEKTLANLSMDEINSFLLGQQQAGITEEFQLFAAAYGAELPNTDYVPMFSGTIRPAIDDTWDGSNGEIEICSNGPHPCTIRSVTRMTDHEPGQSRKRGG